MKCIILVIVLSLLTSSAYSQHEHHKMPDTLRKKQVTPKKIVPKKKVAPQRKQDTMQIKAAG